MFVVLEGADGVGKSTQVRLVAARLREQGLEVVETFEPGATPAGRGLRRIVLDVATEIDPRTEALVMAADRAQHVAEVIRPALERGAVVLSDRYVASSLVYQGVVRGLGVDAVERINEFATGGLAPDAVVVLDVPQATTDERRDGSDRLEAEPATFHRAVCAAYLDLAAARGWTVIDADADTATVADRILGVLDAVDGRGSGGPG